MMRLSDFQKKVRNDHGERGKKGGEGEKKIDRLMT